MWQRNETSRTQQQQQQRRRRHGDMEKRCARPIQTEKNKVGVERMDIFISYFS
jgi:hypothetical protein